MLTLEIEKKGGTEKKRNQFHPSILTAMVIKR